MPPETPPDETDAASDEARRRRTVIRLLVGIGIGIPILIELATFAGLVEQSLLGGGDGDADGTGATATSSSTRGVAPGDELLPETPQRETLTTASFRAGDDQWVLTLVASVENTGDEPYHVQFGSATTETDRVVEGASRSVSVAPGESKQLTGTWQLKPGNRPAAVEVRASTGDEELTAYEVTLAPIPVEGN